MPVTRPAEPPAASSTSRPFQPNASARSGSAPTGASFTGLALHQLGRGAGGVELAAPDALQPRPRPRLVPRRRLHPPQRPPRPRGRDPQRLVAQGAGTALLERPLGLDVGAVLVDLRRQLLDALAAGRLGAQ